MKAGKESKENDQPVIKLDYFDLRADTVNIFCILENYSLRTFDNECFHDGYAVVTS